MGNVNLEKKENENLNTEQKTNEKSNKVTLIALYVFLTITVFFSTNVVEVDDREKTLSINGMLEFVMPEGYRDAYEVLSLSEIFIVDELEQNNIIADILYVDELTIDDFFLAQGYIAQTIEPISFVESTTSKGGTSIINQTYVFDLDGVEFYHNVNVIDDGDDNYIGVLGSVAGALENEKISEFVNSIAYTDMTLDKARTVSDFTDTIEVTLPPNWKKISRDSTNNYIKLDENFELNLDIEVVLKDEYSSVDDFFDEVTTYLVSSMDLEHFDVQTEKLPNSTVHSKLFASVMPDLSVYGYFFITEFEELDEYVISTVNIVGHEPIENFEDEIREMINSISIKNK